MTAANTEMNAYTMTKPFCCGTAGTASPFCAYQQTNKMCALKDTLAVSFLLTLISLPIRLHLVVILPVILTVLVAVILHVLRKTRV